MSQGAICSWVRWVQVVFGSSLLGQHLPSCYRRQLTQVLFFSPTFLLVSDSVSEKNRWDLQGVCVYVVECIASVQGTCHDRNLPAAVADTHSSTRATSNPLLNICSLTTKRTLNFALWASKQVQRQEETLEENYMLLLFTRPYDCKDTLSFYFFFFFFFTTCTFNPYFSWLKCALLPPSPTAPPATNLPFAYWLLTLPTPNSLYYIHLVANRFCGHKFIFRLKFKLVSTYIVLFFSFFSFHLRVKQQLASALPK